MTTIPLMTDPLGKYWKQPKLSEIEVYDNQVMMSKQSFDKLSNYQLTIPTGKYFGKMWVRYEFKSFIAKRPILCWYDVNPDPNYVSIKTRKIIIE